MNIRRGEPKDADRLMEIFDHARDFMRRNGNANQWIDGYPSKELIVTDIEGRHCYVCESEEDGRIVGTFCFIEGPDPAYAEIYDGCWPDEQPYYVIHRLASDGTCKGVAAACLDWCFQRASVIRVDTHQDNTVMRTLLEKNGFCRCGVIRVANGTPRVAFQKNLSNSL